MSRFNWKDKELIRESEWMRVYRTGDNEFSHVSKFITDDLEVSAEALKSRWQELSSDEQLDFTQAILSKQNLNEQDNDVIDFLMQTGPDFVWLTISSILPRYCDRERALQFLLERVDQKETRSSNYYQALEDIGDSRAIPFLRKRYEEYRRNLVPLEQYDFWTEILDYQVCCRALWKLTGSSEYEESLREMLSHPDERVRKRAGGSLAS